MTSPSSQPQLAALRPEQIRDLFEKTARIAHIPDEASAHFEGSINEGFGNEGSDVDFLLLQPGEHAELIRPLVLFVDDRRVEVRSQSHGQLRARLLQTRHAIDSRSSRGVTEDLLNRAQRFLRGTALRVGPGYQELRDIVSYAELAQLLARWWRNRAVPCLRQAAALALLDHDSEAVTWAREGLTQIMKSFLAAQGEGYVEVKWLPAQIDRLRRTAEPTARVLLDEYQALEATPAHALGHKEFLNQALALAARLGAPKTKLDPSHVVLKPEPGVSAWPIGSTTHIIRKREDVLVLSPDCARSWQQITFGETLAQTPAAKDHVRLFAMYGLIALGWRNSGTIRPAAAMSDANRPLTPLPSSLRPPITITGAAHDGLIARSPIPAASFAECGFAMLWATMVVENAREDFGGALKNRQWGVATLCARRIATIALRSLASAYGITPLPSDAVLLHESHALIPEHPELTSKALELAELSIRNHEDAIRIEASLTELVSGVHLVTFGGAFPASYESAQGWRSTRQYIKEWLRMAGHVNAYIENDDTRDLMKKYHRMYNAPAEPPGVVDPSPRAHGASIQQAVPS